MNWKKKREVCFRYNAQADAYDELYSEEQRAKYELVLSHLALRSEERILDSGCGTGILLERVAGRVESAVGVDFSPRMLAKAKLKLKKRSNVELVCADFDHLPFLEGWFTHIFMFDALPDPASWDPPLREALRVLGTEGGVALAVPKKEVSQEELLENLSIQGLELREFIIHRDAPDHLLIGERFPQPSKACS